MNYSTRDADGGMLVAPHSGRGGKPRPVSCFLTRGLRGQSHTVSDRCGLFIWQYFYTIRIHLFIKLYPRSLAQLWADRTLSRVSRAGLPNRRGGTTYAARLLALLLHLPLAALALALLLLTFWSLVFAF